MNLLIDGVCEAKNGRSLKSNGCLKPKGHDGPDASGLDKWHINGKAELWLSDNYKKSLKKSKPTEPASTSR